MTEIDYFEIEVSKYHDDIVARIQFVNNGEVEQSSLYSINELNNIITLWAMGELLGSFAIGTKLAKQFKFQIFQRG